MMRSRRLSEAWERDAEGGDQHRGGHQRDEEGAPVADDVGGAGAALQEAAAAEAVVVHVVGPSRPADHARRTDVLGRDLSLQDSSSLALVELWRGYYPKPNNRAPASLSRAYGNNGEASSHGFYPRRRCRKGRPKEMEINELALASPSRNREWKKVCLAIN
jgi:hypothetical protein